MRTNNFYLKFIKLSVIILLIIILFLILKKNFYNLYEGVETLNEEEKIAELDKIIQSYTDDMQQKLRNIINEKTNEAKNFTLNLIAEYEMINKDILNESYILSNDERDKINSLKSKIQSKIDNYKIKFNEKIIPGVFIDLHTLDKDKIKGLINNYI